MAWQAQDSFDHYGAPSDKYASVIGAPTISANGRNSTSCLTLSNYNQGIDIPITGSPTTVYVGFALNTSALFDGFYIIQFKEGAQGHVGIRVNANGSVEARRSVPSGTQTLLGTASAAGAISNSTYVYIEAKVFVHDSTGTVDVKVNGSSVLSLSSQDTRDAGTGVVSGIRLFGNNNGAATIYIDDLLCYDSTGTTFNAFQGDVALRYHAPNGAGNSAQFTRGGADSGANWSQCDEASANGDTDYVTSSTVGQRDTYACTNLLSTGASILGVRVIAQAQQVDAGSSTLAMVVRHNGTDNDGTGQALSSGSYGFVGQFYATNPGTAGAWTETDFNAMEPGFTKTA